MSKHEKARIEYETLRRMIPETHRALSAISAEPRRGGLPKGLVHLVHLRASLMNGCEFCIALHTHEARRDGVEAAKIEAVEHWRAANVFDARERAAFAWTEALTRLQGGDVPDEVYGEVNAQFSEKEVALLTSAIVAINAWNRIAIAYHFPVNVHVVEQAQ
jgi:AhpD family alkylhydroperoxidase